MLHKYLIQIKKKYSSKLIDIDHMKLPITSFVHIIEYWINEMVNKKCYFQRSETGYITHLGQKRVKFGLFEESFFFNLIFFLVEKKGKNVILMPLIIKKTISKGSRCP